MICLGLFIGILLSCIVFFIYHLSQKYEMGQIVFKSITYSYGGGSNFGKKTFFLHCVVKDSAEVLNYKLEVAELVFNSYKEGDNFPVKK